MMHRTEVNVLDNNVYIMLRDEALCIGERHVDALKAQRARQLFDAMSTYKGYMKEAPQTDVLNDILNRDLV